MLIVVRLCLVDGFEKGLESGGSLLLLRSLLKWTWECVYKMRKGGVAKESMEFIFITNIRPVCDQGWVSALGLPQELAHVRCNRLFNLL